MKIKLFYAIGLSTILFSSVQAHHGRSHDLYFHEEEHDYDHHKEPEIVSVKKIDKDSQDHDHNDHQD